MPKVNEKSLRRRAWALSALIHLCVLAGLFHFRGNLEKLPGIPATLSVRIGNGTGAPDSAAGSSPKPAKRAKAPENSTATREENRRAEIDNPPSTDISSTKAPDAADDGEALDVAEPSPALLGIGDATSEGDSGKSVGAGGSAVLVGPGGYLSQAPRPPYPAWARERGIEGRIEFEIEVLATGRVGQVRLVSDTTGSPELVRYTAQWISKELRYEPARMGNVPVTTYDRRAWVYAIR